MSESEHVLAVRARVRMRSRDESVQGSGYRVPDRLLCVRCSGLGKRSPKKGHRPDCQCVACLPCKHCNGTGRVAVERPSRQRTLEVADERYLEEGEVG